MFTKKEYSRMRLMLLFMLSLSFISCAQTKPPIRKSYGFYTEKLPGNIPVGENGETLPIRRDTTVTICLVTTTKLISWDTAWKKGQAYLISAQLLDTTPFEAGVAKKNNKKIVVTAGKGDFLWQLYLSPIENGPALPGKIKGDEIMLKGKYKGKTITWTTGPLVELIPIPSV